MRWTVSRSLWGDSESAKDRLDYRQRRGLADLNPCAAVVCDRRFPRSHQLVIVCWLTITPNWLGLKRTAALSLLKAVWTARLEILDGVNAKTARAGCRRWGRCVRDTKIRACIQLSCRADVDTGSRRPPSCASAVAPKARRKPQRRCSSSTPQLP